MKKLLVVAATIALLAVIAYGALSMIISRVWAGDAVATSAARPWPGGMGSLADVADRLPPLQANDASAKLTAAAHALPNNEAADDFVWREVSRGDLTIGQPPALPDVSAIRELLLRQPIVWERREGIDYEKTVAIRAVHMTVAKTLVASALTKARADEQAAWEDLHAAWILDRALDNHPQMMLQTAALTTARMINAVAWKMPLPAPAWLGELQQRDNVRPLLEAFQHLTASDWADSPQMFPTRWLAESMEHNRLLAEKLLNTSGCDVSARAKELRPQLRSVWLRAFRYRAEREATANALRVREGKPIESASRCTGGVWSFDGTTLRFSRPIPTAAPDRPMPLVLNVKR